ncbi:hypothetical protein BDP27DRAFT_1370531 [Rhodocollybia butyracea]|uniref:Uncharacterized protein n=1 Tax=Rhodocollybia butyracea TaxID=206335 RepID=A0A9P5U0E8_9AGAR|nr:hypothetical protein BDP27DRAFT_1370531 [Rhodocollybia butyracea]
MNFELVDLAVDGFNTLVVLVSRLDEADMIAMDVTGVRRIYALVQLSPSGPSFERELHELQNKFDFQRVLAFEKLLERFETRAPMATSHPGSTRFPSAASRLLQKSRETYRFTRFGFVEGREDDNERGKAKWMLFGPIPRSPLPLQTVVELDGCPCYVGHSEHAEKRILSTASGSVDYMATSSACLTCEALNPSRSVDGKAFFNGFPFPLACPINELLILPGTILGWRRGLLKSRLGHRWGWSSETRSTLWHLWCDLTFEKVIIFLSAPHPLFTLATATRVITPASSKEWPLRHYNALGTYLNNHSEDEYLN